MVGMSTCPPYIFRSFRSFRSFPLVPKLCLGMRLWKLQLPGSEPRQAGACRTGFPTWRLGTRVFKTGQRWVREIEDRSHAPAWERRPGRSSGPTPRRWSVASCIPTPERGNDPLTNILRMTNISLVIVMMNSKRGSKLPVILDSARSQALLGNAALEAPAPRLRASASWSLPHRVPNLEVGNPRI